MDTTKSYLCPNCRQTFYGRSNKIFCSPRCRGEYYRKQHKEESDSVNQRRTEYINTSQPEKAFKVTMSDNSNDNDECNPITRLTIVTDNKVVINVIKQICTNNNIKLNETTKEALPLLIPDKDGNFFKDGKMLYTSNMVAGMLNIESRVISARASNIGIYPIARGPVSRNPQANLYSEEDAFKIMEALSK